jgi:hypothetical protein
LLLLPADVRYALHLSARPDESLAHAALVFVNRGVRDSKN